MLSAVLVPVFHFVTIKFTLGYKCLIKTMVNLINKAMPSGVSGRILLTILANLLKETILSAGKCVI